MRLELLEALRELALVQRHVDLPELREAVGGRELVVVAMLAQGRAAAA